jgi:hypothetical protein
MVRWLAAEHGPIANRAALRCLALVSRAKAARAAVVQAGALPALVRFLRSNDAILQEKAAGALANVLLNEELVPAVVAAGAAPALGNAVRTGEAAVQRAALLACANLLSKMPAPQIALEILAAASVEAMAAALATDDTVRAMVAARAVAELARVPEAGAALAAGRVCSRLSALLHRALAATDDAAAAERLALQSLTALDNLVPVCDAATAQEVALSLVPALQPGSSDKVYAAAAHVLASIVARFPELGEALAAAAGPALVSALRLNTGTSRRKIASLEAMRYVVCVPPVFFLLD